VLGMRYALAAATWAVSRVWHYAQIVLRKLAPAAWAVLLALLLPGVIFRHTAVTVVAPPSSPPASSVVCGQPVLTSPYTYTGATGPYRSGPPGLPTYGTPSSAFPTAPAGDVLPPQTHDYPSFELAPDTVYYLEPGDHIGNFQAKHGDVFIGGTDGGTTSVV